jgi:hypothetical protein
MVLYVRENATISVGYHAEQAGEIKKDLMGLFGLNEPQYHEFNVFSKCEEETHSIEVQGFCHQDWLL